MAFALNSGISLLSRLSTSHLDLSVILPFTLSAALATVLGKWLADRLPTSQLKLAFAALLVLVAAYTAWQSVLSITEGASVTTRSHLDRSIDQAIASHFIAHLDAR